MRDTIRLSPWRPSRSQPRRAKQVFPSAFAFLLLGLMLLWLTPVHSAHGQLVQNVVNQPCQTCAPIDVELADLNDDGLLDVVAVSEDDLRVSWFEGLGASGFGPQQIIFDDWTSIKPLSNNARPRDVTTADLDNDGLPEVIVLDNAQSSGNGAVVYFENRTDEGGDAFGAVTVITETLRKPQEVVATDFDGDTDVDLVVTSSLSPEVVTWFSNDGSGTFTRETDIISTLGNPYSLDVADVGGDGDQDLVVAIPFDDEFYLIESTRSETGSETYNTPVRFAAPDMDPAKVDFVDLDQNGTIDILVAEHGPNELAWHSGNGDGTFGARQPIGPARRVDDFQVIDADLDGNLDIVFLDQNGLEDVAIYENDGSMTFTLATIARDVGPMFSLDMADVRGDARPDLVVAFFGEDYIAFYENETATGSWGDSEPLSTPPDLLQPQDAIAADLDGDTWEDIVVSSISSGIVWYRNQQDGTFAAKQLVSDTRSLYTRAADMDQDGDLDLVSTDYNPLYWHENRLNEATNDFAPASEIDGTLVRLRDAKVADFNGDGYPDIVGVDRSQDVVLYFENRLDEPSADIADGVDISGTVSGPYGLDVDDFDNDGDLDVAYGALSDNEVAWIENDLNGPAGGFILPPFVIDGSFNRSVGAWTGDFNNDGFADVLTAGTGGTDLTYFLNQIDDNTTADFSAGVEAARSLNPSTMVIGDLNEDGIDDIVYINDLSNINRSEIYAITAEPGSATGFGPPILVTTKADVLSGLDLADFNQDGLPDILSSSEDDNKIAWYPNDQDVLPVELASFTGRIGNGHVALAWTTASETNNAGFAVERRAANGAFAEIAFVEGAGTSTDAQSYRFTDRQLPRGANRLTYRLRQVDLDGTASYSAPVTVQVPLPERASLLAVAPNPASGPVTLNVSVPSPTDVSVTVYDMMGRRVATVANRRLGAGRSSLYLDAGALATGTYFVRMVAGDAVTTKHLTVVR